MLPLYKNFLLSSGVTPRSDSHGYFTCQDIVCCDTNNRLLHAARTSLFSRSGSSGKALTGALIPMCSTFHRLYSTFHNVALILGKEKHVGYVLARRTR